MNVKVVGKARVEKEVERRKKFEKTKIFHTATRSVLSASLIRE